MSKYHNNKVVFGGIRFDSKREARRFSELRILEKAGVIQNLRRQVPFELIPTQKLPKPYKKPGNKGMTRSEGSVKYIADFVYERGDETIVEDTKGMRTPDYIIKRKLMLFVHGIQVTEV